MGYPDRSKGYRFCYPSHNTKFVESINVKFFERGDLTGSRKIKEIVFEEERQTVAILIVLNNTDVPIELESAVIPDRCVINQATESNVEIPLGRSQRIRRLPISDDYVISMRVILI